MRNVFRLFIFFTFCTFIRQASAQLTLTIADQMVNCEDNSFCVDVDVTNFNQVSGMQFALMWDPALFSYASHQHFLPSPPIFNLPDTTLGFLPLVWFSNDFLNGLTLSDDSTIITLCLEPLANAGTSDSVTISPQPGVGQSIQFSTIPDGILDNATQVSLNSSTITIFDNVPPTITCPPDDTVFTATLTGADPIIMENCAIEFLTHTLSGATNTVGTGSANGSVLQEGVTNISYLATDYAGQSAGCNFDITYQDTSTLDPNVLYFVPNITHDCANDRVTIEVEVINFDSLASMQFGIFWDTSMIKYISHTDFLPPSANFINTLAPDGTLVLIWVPNPTPGGVSLADSSTIFSIEFDVSGNLVLPLISFDTINTLNLEIGSLRDFAVNGRLDTTQWELQNGNLTVLDMMPPVLDCAGLSDVILTSDANACGTTFSWTPPTATDDCGTVTVTGSHTPGDFFSVGVDTVVYIATDGVGNTDTCSFTVTVSDNMPPTLSCPGDVTVNNDLDNCGAIVNGIALVSSMDNCPTTISYVLSGATVAGPIAGNDASGTFFNVDTTTVTYTVTDNSGNSENCSFLVIVNDTQNPSISCPANITVSVDPGSCDAAVTVPDPTVSDNCPGFSLVNDFNNTVSASGTYPIGTTTVKWIITDASNNQDSCTMTVTVVDDEAPTITCPADITVSVDAGSCDAMVAVPDPMVGDNCPGFSLINDFNNTVSASGTYPIGTTTVQWIITDASNNRDSCTMTVTVVDDEAPTITCPTDITVPTDGGGCDAAVTVPAPTVVENCPGFTLVNDFNNTADASGTYPIGTTTVQWIVTDASNNRDTCTMTVTVTDPQPLSITCPGDVVINNATGPTVVNNLDPTITNACGTTTLTYRRVGTMVETGNGSLSGATFQPGQTNVTYFVTDPNGQIDSCSFTVTIDVPNSDLIDCVAPANTNNQTDSCNAIVNNIDPIFLVAQGGVTLTYSLTGATVGSGTGSVSGLRFNVGTTEVTYFATDGVVNDTCRFDVVVVDAQRPSITCPADIIVDAAPALCSQNVNWTDPVATDNCPGVTLTSSHNSGNLFTVGTPTTVQYIATDAAGLSDTCTFTVTVRDVTPPNFNNCPPADITLTPISGCRVVATWTAPNATDACTNTTLVSTHMPGDTFPEGTTTVIYTATDESNNSSTCSFDIVYMDNEAPVFMGCPLDQTASIDSANCGALVGWQAPIPSDNCDNDLTITSNFSPGDFFPVGTTLVRYIAIDDANNADTCDFTVTVIDDQAPIMTCSDSLVLRVDGTVIADPGNILVDATVEPGCSLLKVSFTDITATDECAGNVAVTQTDATGLSNGSSFPIGVTTLQYSATDTSNNTANCDLRIVILPLDPIEITFLPDANPCLGQDVILSVGTLDNVSGYSWSGPASFSSTAATPAITDLELSETGSYSVTVTFNSGCTLVDDAILAPQSAPVITATTNSPVCDGVLNLNAVVDPNGEPAASYVWTGPNSFSSTDADIVIPNADDTFEGTYFLTVTGDNGCESRDTLSVNIVNLAAPTITSDCDNSLCIGESCLLIGTEYSPIPDSYNWSATPSEDAGLPAFTNTRQIAIRPTAQGSIVYDYWVIKDGCSSDTATITVEVVSDPIAVNDTFTVNYNTTLENFNVLPNDTFNTAIGITPSINTITSNGSLTDNGDGTYTYVPNRNFIGTDQFIYEICHNCEGQLLCDQAVVTINVVFPDDAECDIPNLISPNGDGTNDEVFINCLATGNFNSNELIIFNKWGDEVFRAAPYLNNWQGTYEGKDLPDGTYYYIFKLDQSSPAQTGFITIYR